ncbi:MAG: lamin tail domain-containing protein [Fidelibacterota bacterium]|nr:MAG: lamin tail domain-containing protein [Candidatus Neomarinimicrobiota bacterium]
MTIIPVIIAVVDICGPLVISEVMFHPLLTGTPDEFVEIVNLSDTTIDLNGWHLADLSIQYPDAITGDQLELPPGGYAVILEGDYDKATGTYCDVIPDSALILFIDDSAIGNGLANSGDSLFLIDPHGDTVDVVGWDLDLEPGQSLEKVILDNCTLAGNWRSGVNIHGTPGSANSLSGKAIDLAISSAEWQITSQPHQFIIFVTVTNDGLIPAEGQLLAQGVWMANVPLLDVGESKVIPFEMQAPAAFYGVYPCSISVAAYGDYDMLNNTVQLELPVAAPEMAIVVNEIMYTPLSGDPEWVEIVNTTTSTVNMKNWEIRDQSSGGLFPGKELYPGDFAVVVSASDSNINWPTDIAVIGVANLPALNNQGDKVDLIDPTSQVIDGVDYSRFSLTSPGRSLEKISPTAPSQEPSSWVVSPSPKGHTVGKPNSVELTTDEVDVILEPNPLRLNTPTSTLIIRYVTPFPSISLSVDIYDLAGRCLSTIANEGPVPGTGVFTWDARVVDQVRYRTGQYAVLFRAKDTGSSAKWECVKRLILVN